MKEKVDCWWDIQFGNGNALKQSITEVWLRRYYYNASKILDGFRLCVHEYVYTLFFRDKNWRFPILVNVTNVVARHFLNKIRTKKVL